LNRAQAIAPPRPYTLGDPVGRKAAGWGWVMISKHKRAGILGLVAIAVLLAACGDKAAPASGGAASTSPEESGQVGVRSISGLGAVLQSPTGFTLYHLKTEGVGKVTCTGDCAMTWPPLIAASGKVPAASPDVASRLGTIERPEGSMQVTFDGMPLYTYIGDSAPGQANGQGVGGVWFAITTSGASPSSDSGYPGY
jgi:predicted lipoprotein with Yx(FWY)xxD motif